jgi:hypothetical protein
MLKYIVLFLMQINAFSQTKIGPQELSQPFIIVSSNTKQQALVIDNDYNIANGYNFVVSTMGYVGIGVLQPKAMLDINANPNQQYALVIDTNNNLSDGAIISISSYGATSIFRINVATVTNTDDGIILSLRNPNLRTLNQFQDSRFLNFGAYDVYTAYIRAVGRDLVITAGGSNSIDSNDRTVYIYDKIRGASWGFGGAYSKDDCGSTNTYNNPLTGGLNCPPGFTAYRVGRYKGAESDCGNNLFICIK